MEWKYLSIVIFAAVIVVGAVFLMFQLYRIIVIDANIRGIKHPRFWGFLIMGNNTGGGLLLYLLKRRNYPVICCNEVDKLAIAKGKKAAGVALSFIVAGTLGIIVSLMIG